MQPYSAKCGLPVYLIKVIGKLQDFGSEYQFRMPAALSPPSM